MRRQHDLNLAKLRELDNALQELFVLKKSYNLIFSLDNYQQVCKVEKYMNFYI